MRQSFAALCGQKLSFAPRPQGNHPIPRKVSVPLVLLVFPTLAQGFLHWAGTSSGPHRKPWIGETSMDARQSSGVATGVKPTTTQDTDARRRSAVPVAEHAPKSVGYGLPCSRCRLYYPADLDHCPGCGTAERVSPVVPAKGPVSKSQAAVQPVADLSTLEQERDEFLRQFKSQLLEAHREIEDAEAGPQACALSDHHHGEDTQALVCKECYEKLQERADVLEATMHMDLKEAAQIIYDAVWADPSDPTKTYQNAAGALLSELRKRSGTNTVMSPFHPLQH